LSLNSAEQSSFTYNHIIIIVMITAELAYIGTFIWAIHQVNSICAKHVNKTKVPDQIEALNKFFRLLECIQQVVCMIHLLLLLLLRSLAMACMAILGLQDAYVSGFLLRLGSWISRSLPLSSADIFRTMIHNPVYLIACLLFVTETAKATVRPKYDWVANRLSPYGAHWFQRYKPDIDQLQYFKRKF
jgi:hypothetical protein